MHPNMKATVAAGVSLLVLVVPGLSHVIHDAGGPQAVAAAAVALSVLIHAIVDRFTSRGSE